MTYSEILDTLKKIGVLRIAGFVSSIAWLLLPFWIWLIVLKELGSGFFVFDIALFGIAFYVVELVVMVGSTLSLMSYGFRVMKAVEKAGAVFNNPADTEGVEKFKNECRKTALVFAHYAPISLSSIKNIKLHSLRYVGERLGSYFVSYSIVTFLVVYQKELLTFYDYLSLKTSQILPIQVGDLPNPLNYLFITLGVLWILSLYNDAGILMIIKSKEFQMPKSQGTGFHLLSIFDASYRSIMIICRVCSLPVSLLNRRRSISRKPFVDPLTLPKIIARTLSNVEGKDCDVLRWEEEPESVSDIDKVKELISKDRQIPFMIKYLARLSSSEDSLTMTKQMQPTTYIAIEGNRCPFFGCVSYNHIEKVREGQFFFDTIYLKSEFSIIYENEAKKQREIAEKLPFRLEDIIGKVGKRIE
jgi:hypothetical protein